jgi:hypothetical protein
MAVTVEDVPNPGSCKAIKQGCKCPVLDNNHGRGFPWGDVRQSFWISGDCPLHGNPEYKENDEA